MPHAQLLLARLLPELFLCNRHFSIKGKTSVTFPNFPSPRVLRFWNHCPYLHVSVPVESLGMSLLPPQHYLKNWLTLFYISFFVGRKKFIFLRLSVFSFFLKLASSWAFFFICLISSLFHLFRASLWRLFASSDLFQLKKMPQIIKICSKGVKALLWVYFLFLSLSSVLSFFFVFLS